MMRHLTRQQIAFKNRLADACTLALVLNKGSVCNCPLGYLLNTLNPSPKAAFDRLDGTPTQLPLGDIEAFIRGYDHPTVVTGHPLNDLGRQYRERFSKAPEARHQTSRWIHVRGRMERFLHASRTEWPEWRIPGPMGYRPPWGKRKITTLEQP